MNIRLLALNYVGWKRSSKETFSITGKQKRNGRTDRISKINFQSAIFAFRFLLCEFFRDSALEFHPEIDFFYFWRTTTLNY
jgi:hypothetical protein